MARFVALLRGINVGGKNLIPKASLVTCFEKLGLAHVSTYIQSGNVLFDAPSAGQAELARRIETALGKAFDYEAAVVLRSRTQMQSIVRGAPPSFTAPGDEYRCDVIFLKDPLTAARALSVVTVKEGVDEAHAGPGVLYFSRLDALASKSRLSRVVGLPEYKNMTIRNFRTTTKLLELMSVRREDRE